jgi:MFS family permease
MTKITTTLYLIQAGFAPLWGLLSDWLVARGMNEATVRRSMIMLYQTTSAIGVLGAGLAGSRELLIACLFFSGMFGGIGGQMSYAISQMFAGRASGAWVGVVNGIGNLSGIVWPLLTGWVIQAAGGNYLSAFILTAAVSFAGALWWVVAVPPIRPDPELHPA